MMHCILYSLALTDKFFLLHTTVLHITMHIIIVEPHPPSVHLESKDSNQLVFAWDEAITQCSPAQYIITAINCGVCPNTTIDTNITCVQYMYTNRTCLFAVQTEICGYLLGGRSEYVTVHVDINGK